MRASFDKSHLSRHLQRGFTLVELVVVVVIIGILAALAIPTITRQMRDRRANQATQTVADLYRGARMQALGRGSSVLVRYRKDADFPRGGLEVWESVATPDSDADRCAPTPVRSCLLNQWPQVGGTSNTAQLVNAFNPATRREYDGVEVDIKLPSSDDDDDVTYLDVCFTPLGASYMATDSTTLTLERMTQIPLAEVSRTNAPAFREVLIMPNGAARVKRKVLVEATE